MTRRALQAAGVIQMGVVFWTVLAAPYLFIPAALGLAILACAIPEETE